MVSVSNLDSPIEPLSNEPELENSLHLAQIILLLTAQNKNDNAQSKLRKAPNNSVRKMNDFETFCDRKASIQAS
jgi:hypothetical protein